MPLSPFIGLIGYYTSLVLFTYLFGRIIIYMNKHLRSSTVSYTMIVLAAYAAYVDLVVVSSSSSYTTAINFFTVLLVIGITFGLAIVVYINNRLHLSTIKVMVAAATTLWATTTLLQFRLASASLLNRYVQCHSPLPYTLIRLHAF